MSPSPRLLWCMVLGLGVSVLPALVTDALWIVVVGMWAVLALALATDLWFLFSARPSVVSEVPSTAGVGGRLSVKLRVGTRHHRALHGTIRPEVSEPLLAGDDLEVLSSPSGSDKRFTLSLLAPRRGPAELRALWLRLAGPLGLMSRIDRFPVEGGGVAIVPNFERVKHLALKHKGVARATEALMKARVIGEGGEFDALSAYAAGMDVRNVDWKASARHSALRVQRFRLERSQRIMICLDAGRLMGDQIEDLTRLDHAIHGALLLSHSALRAGDHVGVFSYASKAGAYLPPGSGMRQMTRVREVCASIMAQPSETNHVLGVHGLLSKLRRRSLIVVFTEFRDPTTAELMVEHLGHLVQRHLVIFVALSDPVLEGSLDIEPRSTQVMAESVVAGSLKYDRASVLNRLKSLGVHVVEGAPGEAPLRLLLRYVDIKRRSLIG